MTAKPWAHGAPFALAFALSLGWQLGAPPPAWGILGQPVQNFSQSLLLGDQYFRFEGRTGARYRFGPARFARFGPGVLALDVADGLVVQELLVLPLPINRQMAQANARVQKLFLAQVGFPPQDLKQAEATIQAALDRGLPQEAALGRRHRLLVRVEVALKSYLLAAQLTGPNGLQAPDPNASPDAPASP